MANKKTLGVAGELVRAMKAAFSLGPESLDSGPKPGEYPKAMYRTKDRESFELAKDAADEKRMRGYGWFSAHD